MIKILASSILWAAVFHLLQELLDRKYNGNKQVIFIDELPWMDTPRANFLSAFEHFCNDWCLARKHVKLIVCGTAGRDSDAGACR
ncbi:MAG: hypothetical protein MJZ17_09345 [Bacteroidales bacterium]|nr:hypothetical protein [Bacteroidales bacterium]